MSPRLYLPSHYHSEAAPQEFVVAQPVDSVGVLIGAGIGILVGSDEL